VCTSYQNPGGSQAIGAVFLVFFMGENGVLGSQGKTATKYVNGKGIGAGDGPLPLPVYRLFGLVAVGP
jgi:hypothetical protein